MYFLHLRHIASYKSNRGLAEVCVGYKDGTPTRTRNTNGRNSNFSKFMHVLILTVFFLKERGESGSHIGYHVLHQRLRQKCKMQVGRCGLNML